MVHRSPCLESMPGIALILDAELRVTDGGLRNWQSFWYANGGAEDAPSVLGQDITEAITPGPVRSAFRGALMAVLRGERAGLTMGFRCDSPELQRAMRLSVTPLSGRRLLYRSELVAERPWPATHGGNGSRCHCPICARTAPEEAPPPVNGTGLNGVGLNGVGPNGAGPNGSHLHGDRGDGIWLDGLGLDWLPPSRPDPARSAMATDPCPRCHLALAAA